MNRSRINLKQLNHFYTLERISASVFSFVLTEKKLYSKVGGEVAFDPGAPAGAKPITSIVWMFGNDLAVEWYAGEVEAYGHFKGTTRRTQ